MVSELNVWLHNNPFKNKKLAKPHSDTILQQLLQNALNTSTSIQVFTNEKGKPYIKEGLNFSHSNSANLYAYVLVDESDNDIALDLEQLRSHRDVMKLATRYFHPTEVKYLSNLKPDDLQLGFYQLWTRKEAWCKLDGGTLWTYLKQAVLSDSTVKTVSGNKVYFKSLPHIKGFIGCLASTKPIKHIRLNSIGQLN